MLILSGAVIAYQVVISLTILGTAVFGGRTALGCVAGLWALWTVTHVIFPWLMIFQFFTIGVSTAIGLVIAKRPRGDLARRTHE